MKHLELHILHTFPVACLNRDDLSSPKTAVFGGVQRARVSSQSWKRAIRELAKEISPRFQGERTRLIIEPLREALMACGFEEAKAKNGAVTLADAVATFDSEAEKKKGKLQVKTLFFTTPLEIQALARSFAQNGDAKKALKSVSANILKDAADISLFGRMVANDHSLTIEGAAMFGHALSTHYVENEIDFFSSVDDRQPREESGAGMTGTQEFNSATYYRFAALNLDMLADGEHLGILAPKERREVVSSFVQATIMAVPGARRNSMNALTTPGYVLGIVRSKGHPVQLVNAFEKPVSPHGRKGFFRASVAALEAEFQELNRLWGLDKDELARCVVPEKTLAEFVSEVSAHV